MSVKVNLLPSSIKRKETARRGNVLLGLIVLALVGLLVLAGFAKQGSVDDALGARDMAQSEVNNVQAQVTALAAFQGLADELAAGNTLLTTAMGDEIAVARVLNDVALSLPSTASLTTLTLSRAVTPPAAGDPDLGGSIADLLLSGYSIERYAPGVEGVLLQFDQVDGLVLTYLNTAAIADIESVEVTSFDAIGLLTDQIYTDRYADGLPEVSQ